MENVKRPRPVLASVSRGELLGSGMNFCPIRWNDFDKAGVEVALQIGQHLCAFLSAVALGGVLAMKPRLEPHRLAKLEK